MDIHISLVGRTDLSGEIYRQLRRAISDGRLRPGDRLLPTRQLAQRLAVARMTVTVAYEKLAAEGVITSRVGSGTVVSAHAVRRATPAGARVAGAIGPRPIWNAIELPSAFNRPARYDFRTGLPDVGLFPRHTWTRLVGRSLRDASSPGAYHEPGGHPALRAAIARHVAISRGVTTAAEDITITNGTQQALDVLARVLLAPGDRIAVEDPGYGAPRRLFRSLGLRVVGVPVDRDGLRVEAMPRRVRAVYTTPSHQYPLGVCMTLARRQALLAWAERHNAAIIEDDYDSEFRFDGRPLETLQSLDTAGRVIYVGSFSKAMLPSLRLGFVVSPPALSPGVRKAKYVTDWHTPTLAQVALARFIDTGEYARHLRRAGVAYRERHERIAATLVREFARDLELVPSSTGLHLTALSTRATVERMLAIEARAADDGVAFQPLSFFSVADRPLAGVVLGYGAIATHDIDDGLAILRRAFSARSTGRV